MATDPVKAAKDRGIAWFLISRTDIVGTMRARLAPAAAIADMAREGGPASRPRST